MKILHTDFSDRSSAESCKAWMKQMLMEFELHLPRMRRECDPVGFWKWYRGEVDSLERNADSEPDRLLARCAVERALTKCLKASRGE